MAFNQQYKEKYMFGVPEKWEEMGSKSWNLFKKAPTCLLKENLFGYIESDRK